MNKTLLVIPVVCLFTVFQQTVIGQDTTKIKNEFKKLEELRIIIYKCEFIRHFMVHLTIRITHDVIKWAELYESTRAGIRPITLNSQFEKMMDRKSYSAKRKYKPTRQKEILKALADEFIKTEQASNLPENTIIEMIKGSMKKNLWWIGFRILFLIQSRL